MASGTRATLYKSVVDITAEYLGPAAPRFIDRQIENHFNKAPDQLNQKDLIELTDWIKVAISLLTEDKHIVDELISRLMALTTENNKVGRATSDS